LSTADADTTQVQARRMYFFHQHIKRAFSTCFLFQATWFIKGKLVGEIVPQARTDTNKDVRISVHGQDSRQDNKVIDEKTIIPRANICEFLWNVWPCNIFV